MNNEVSWQYNEFIQAGATYADVQRAVEYDEQMQKIRNPEKRAEDIIDRLLINDNDIVVDLGCGTGVLTVEFAKKCRSVIGVDTSSTMLEIALKNTKHENVSNVSFVNAGFLSYNHEGELADKILTSGAFHHLPDFWKVIALQRMNEMLKSDGILFISDVIFSFEPKDYVQEINTFLEFLKVKSEDILYRDGILHAKEEFSTFDWLMDEMLRHTGFVIEEKKIKTSTNMNYICRKAAD